MQRLARQRFRRSAFADVQVAKELLERVTERALAVLTLRQVRALRLYSDG